MNEFKNPINFNPKTVPVIQVDTHLPELTPEQVSEPYLRWRFDHTTLNWHPEQINNGIFKPISSWRQAAILLPLVKNNGQLHVLFTRRNKQLKNHAGQISFPGGKIDPQDINATAAALRETYEETGIASQAIETLGTLPPCKTGTAFEITPAVGLIQTLPKLKLEPQEVEEAFLVPLAFLMTPANHRWHALERCYKNGTKVTWRWISIEYTSPKQNESYFIWGATAEILRNLYWFLRAN